MFTCNLYQRLFVLVTVTATRCIKQITATPTDSPLLGDDSHSPNEKLDNYPPND